MELLPSKPSCKTPDPDSLQQAAEAFATEWQRIELALVPILGMRGVTAIYARALHTACTQHAVLRALPGVPLTNPDALAAHFQDQEGAAVALDALLASFDTLLCDLIGASLTRRLLGARHAPSDASVPAPEASP